MDRLSTRTDPSDNAESFQHDGNRNLTWAKDRKNQVTTFQYGGLNRRTGVQFVSGMWIPSCATACAASL